MSFSLYVYAPTDGISSLTVGYSTGESYYTYPAGTSTSCHTNTAVPDGTTITITPRFDSGYQFSRWVINADGAVSYSYNSTLSYQHTGASAVYLRVEVVQLSTYYATLIFDANGGSGAPSSMSGSNTGSSTITFTIPYTTPTRSGYTFGGWELSYTGGSSIYQPGDTISVQGYTIGVTFTLVAIWEEIPTYYATLEFDANGGTGAPSSITKSNTGNSTITFTIPTTIPTRSGYTFAGWELTYTGGSTVYQPGGTVSTQGYTIGVTFTLVAVWIENAGGGVHIGIDGWNSAAAYIYLADGWAKAIPYIYTTDGWKKGV